jgi:hypothetical protein
VEGDGDCFKIFRIEDVGLQELVTAFLEVTRGFVVPSGNVVALSSASYMAWVGAAAYAHEYVSARNRLRVAFGGGIEVIHGVPVLAAGIQDCAGTWAIKDVFNWLEHMSSSSLGRDVVCTRELLVKALCNLEGPPLAPQQKDGPALPPPCTTVTPLAAVQYHLSMPACLEQKGMAVYEMSHLPTNTSVNPFTQAESEKIIDTLISELNEKFLTDLGVIHGTADDGSTVDEEGVKFIFVGCSHAKRMVAAAERMDITHSVIPLPGYRIMAAAVAAASEQLQDEVQTSDGRVVTVCAIYDNNAYFGVGDDGTKTMPVKISGGGDGYHVQGHLEVADHSVIKALVNSSIPLRRSAGETEKIIISPLPRYIIPCCGDADHITNRNEEDFKLSIVDGLGEVRRSLQDLIFGKKLKNFKILDPLSLMYGNGGDESRKKGCWNPLDPIHPSASGYDALVQGLMSSYAETNYNRPYTPQHGDGSGERHRRQSWVAEDDTTAHRTYNERGRGRGRGNWRGRGRGSWRGGRGDGRGGGRGVSHGGGSGRGGYFKFVRPKGYKKNRGRPYYFAVM